MIPTLMRLRIVEKSGKKLRLFIPLFLVWILLLPFVLVFTPFILIVALILWPSGYGRTILGVGPALFRVICSLSGLIVQAKDEENIVFISIT